VHFNFPTEEIVENSVKILVPKQRCPPLKAPVFYNPVMKFNRDVAVVALQIYQKMLSRGITVCEPLAGCGVRGIRFAVEVNGIKSVLINDLNPEAVRLAKYNVKKNRLLGKVSVKNMDANTLLSIYSAPAKRFDYVDVDPFGSPAPFIDSAVRALHDGGVLALTATDMAPLCGVHPEACLRKYGGKPLRTEYCHELAVRLLIGCLALTAAKHEVGVEVMFCHSTDHYVRVYSLMRHSSRKANESIGDLGYILHCFNCFHRETVLGVASTLKEKCPECGGKLSAAGPLWLGRLFDRKFCIKMVEEIETKGISEESRIRRLLDTALIEMNGPQTYYVIDRICDKLDLLIPQTEKVVKKLQENGYKATVTHFKARSIRTDTPAKKFMETIKRFSRS